MKSHFYLYEYFQSRRKAMTCHVLKVCGQQGILLSPDVAARFGHESVAACVFLDKFHIAVAVGCRAYFAEFRRQPKTGGQ